jgi:hypothetical protein
LKQRPFRALDERRTQIIWEIRFLAQSPQSVEWRKRRIRIRQRALNLLNKQLRAFTAYTTP